MLTETELTELETELATKGMMTALPTVDTAALHARSQRVSELNKQDSYADFASSV